ncbi:hypothetical protein GYMLUDRAFT_67972 [Collybiopsis luxurians FD-317 M1]|nr:hypothetical protein GYMLUDRAFT_67972 [Collybiopsis luxurians FD-317 M1]
MKRSQSRASSPTPTVFSAFSGISNYRTESYRPINTKNAPKPHIDYRSISKIHFDELSQYLTAYPARSAPNFRSTERQRLTRLTTAQFHELSTDVYDELIRRKNEKEVPFLPVREEFHPKRNQARQKLAALPTSRFKNLSGDVYFELSRQYPEFKEDPTGRASDDDYPAPGYPSSIPPRGTNTSRTSNGGRASLSGDNEKMQRDYELRIATMQTQLSNLQRNLDDSQQTQSKLEVSETRVRQLEDELASVLQRAEEQNSTMRALRKELDELQETRQREKEREARRAQEDDEELQILRDRLEKLEEERANGRGTGANVEVVEQLRADMLSLLTEVSDLSRRNDELMTAKDSDLIVIRDLDNQLKEYKRKYEQAKTELRSVKATSQLFVQAPKIEKLECQLPVSADGGVLDIHITAFLSAIDGLLTAGRSNVPTRVLSPMRSVVNAVADIIDNVRVYEKRLARSDIRMDLLRSLREQAEVTLSDLATASKTHATSSGMSPVSVLDAAASHVAATITDIGKLIHVRKATKAEQEQFISSSYSPSSSATNGFSPSLRSVNEKGHQWKSSAASSVLGSSLWYDNQMYRQGRSSNEYVRRTPSDNSSSEKRDSPPLIFGPRPNTGGTVSDGDGTELNWAELKPYLEARTESIFYAVQSVLSGIRSPTSSRYSISPVNSFQASRRMRTMICRRASFC